MMHCERVDFSHFICPWQVDPHYPGKVEPKGFSISRQNASMEVNVPPSARVALSRKKLFRRGESRGG